MVYGVSGTLTSVTASEMRETGSATRNVPGAMDMERMVVAQTQHKTINSTEVGVRSVDESNQMNEEQGMAIGLIKHIPEIVEALSDSDDSLRKQACEALMLISRYYPDAIPNEAIPVIFSNSDIKYSSRQISGYYSLGDSVYEILANIGERSIDYLLEEIAKKPIAERKAQVISNALYVIEIKRPGSMPDAALSYLSKQTECLEAAWALGRAGANALEYLTPFLSSDDESLRWWAAEGFKQMLASNPGAISSDVLEILQQSPYVSVSDIGMVGKRAIPYLNELLLGDETKAQYSVLSHQFSWISDDEDYLTGLINDLVKNGYIDQSGIIQSRFKDLDESIALELSLKYQERAKDIRRVLNHVLHYDKLNACRVLGDIAKNNPESIPDEIIPLVAMYIDSDCAPWTLGYIGERAIPYIAKALLDKDGVVRASACVSLYVIAQKDPSVIPDNIVKELVKTLLVNEKCPCGDVSGYISTALENIGDRSIPFLREAFNTQDVKIARRVQEIIDRIQSKGR